MASSVKTSLLIVLLYSSLAYGAWSAWGKCSTTCGKGEKVRKRACETDELGCDEGSFVKETQDCSSRPCGPLQCHEGMISSVGGFTVVNTFQLKKCTEMSLPPKTKDKSGRTGLQCSMIKMQITRGGVPVTLYQGGCFNKDMCKSVTCEEYSKQLGTYQIDKCEVECCREDGCNDPDNFVQPVFDNPDIVKACSSNPCKNGGSCIDVADPSGNPSHICSCTKGFSGKNCTETANRLCYTGVSTRSVLAPPTSPMLSTSCVVEDDDCMIATVSAHLNGVAVYVDTAQCASSVACNKLTCENLKQTLPDNYDITSCKITCCKEDYCNQAHLKMPEITTTTRATTTRKTPKPTTRPKTKKPKTTKKPKPKPKPKTTKAPKKPRKPKTTGIPLPTTTPSGPHWSQWQSWQACTHRCGNSGTRQRFRFCMKGAPGMPGCAPVSDMAGKEPCNTDVSCTRWREWNNWQSCSRSCGGGERERRRTCDGGAPNTPGCMGQEMKKERCNEQSCDETTTTSTTTTTTRSTTTTTKQSTTTNKPPTTKAPTVPPTKPVRGWSQWGEWEMCTTTCGVGSQSRSRQCFGGRAGRRPCRGRKMQKQDCKQSECESTSAVSSPTPKPRARWSSWSDWEACSVSCGKGTTSRSRQCLYGRQGRRGCRGKAVERSSCEKTCAEEKAPVEVECMIRDAKTARKRGRKCPLECYSDGNCDDGKKCVCDGYCGETCQDTSQRCINILEVPEGTKVSCSNANYVGSKCTFSCEDGYSMVGEPDVFCQGTTKWTNQKKLPKCKGSPAREGSSASKETDTKTCKMKYASHDSCCGTVSYRSEKSRCCQGKVSSAWLVMSECCGTKPYNPAKFGCCEGVTYRISNQKCQDGNVVRK